MRVWIRDGDDKSEVAEHSVEFIHRGAQPRRPFGNAHADQLLDSQSHSHLTSKGSVPIVAIGQAEDLSVIAGFKELFGAAMHMANQRLCGCNAITVETYP